jgi:hypothetical protein
MAADPSKKIDGREYTFGRIPPTKSVPLQVQLLKIVGPELQFMLTQDPAKWVATFAALTAKDKTPEEKGVAASAIMGELMVKIPAALAGVIQNADGAEVMRIMTVAFGYTKCNGNTIDEREIDIVFADSDPGTMWKVFFESLRVNYRGFFPVAHSASSQPMTTG